MPLHEDNRATNSPIVHHDSAEPTFKLRDLELFYNFKACFIFDGNDPVIRRLSDAIYQQSFAMPYLMDQLLALSAAHMSTQRPNQASFYRQEATRRQTQALATFNNSMTTDNSDECLPAFFFSILISQQALFDAFATRASFSALLDKLITGLHICAMVRAVAGNSLGVLARQYHQHTGCEFPGMKAVIRPLGTGFNAVFSAKLADLKRHIEEADVGDIVSKSCFTALELLLDDGTADAAHGPLGSTAIRVVRWMVTVPTEFVKLIEQRRPEALIVVAHCAVLMHDARDCWLFGDAGSFIVHSFIEYLGPCWAEWLAWPSEVISRAPG
ncbi:hypothetical protein GGR51DRAFT_522894 [Nemania sp. FL0031]|nr:hypothetical protein GGR51DRAFT_522894 [Nemania sp. FL0031]